MRLIKADTFQIHEFPSAETAPAFAILSHTWGDHECTLRDMDHPSVQSKTGFLKIKYCCEQALKDGLHWAWVDTLVFNLGKPTLKRLMQLYLDAVSTKPARQIYLRP
jgi:hypothetical protein